MYSDKRTVPLRTVGSPIRKSSDITSTYNSPRHIGVSPVLLQLLVARHSPCALIHLTSLTSLTYCFIVPRQRIRSSICSSLFALIQFSRYRSSLTTMWWLFEGFYSLKTEPNNQVCLRPSCVKNTLRCYRFSCQAAAPIDSQTVSRFLR